MDLQDLQNTSIVNCLPDEIIVIILQNSSPRDILNFGATCKRYNDVVKSHNSLWRNKCATTFPLIIYNVIEEFYNGYWLREMKYYCELKEKIHSELIAVSPKYYWMSLNYVNFSSLYTFTEVTPRMYFYAIHILQDIIEKGDKLIDKNQCIRPYTLTDMYNAKAVLRHLMHTYLAIKWTKAKVQHNLPPEVVINFFLQWVDPAKLHLDEEVHKKINVLVEQVKKVLESENKSNGRCSDIQIINAVSHVIYKQRRIALTTSSDLDTLNICKAIDNKCGNVVVVAAIYQAVATRCGACCELIVFPNHLYLEWNDHDTPGKQLYNIDLSTGDVYPKRQCPFSASQRKPPSRYSYCPDSLLQHIYSSFVITMGALRTWNTQNAMHLLGFLGTENEHAAFNHNPYKDYYTHSMENFDTLIRCRNPNIKQLADEHIKLIISLANLNKIDNVPSQPRIVKPHTGSVKFAVGMICYHKRYDYVCIIRGWDLNGCKLHFPLDDLYFGRNQPFYYITAADQSERYVAQENLMEVTRPTRLYHLDYQISRDFTHFDGFAYVLNDQKRVEYPEDVNIVEVFRAICRDKPNNI